MTTEKHTIIISTPEELFPLITEAVRLAGYDNARNTSESPAKKLLAPKEMEKEFGIHRKTLSYWRQEGVGPAYTNFGRRVFYERDALEEYIASGRTSDSIR